MVQTHSLEVSSPDTSPSCDLEKASLGLSAGGVVFLGRELMLGVASQIHHRTELGSMREERPRC